MKMEKAFVFDMDGTLFDTESLLAKALRAVSEGHGENPEVDDFYPTTCGTTLPVAEQLYKGFFGQDYPFEERRQEMREWVGEYVEKNGMPIKPGAVELLEYLKANQYKIALATSSTRRSAESHLERSDFMKYFDVTVCGDEIKKCKPDPEIFLAACKKLGVEPECAYAAEDSYNGVKAAAAAGMTVFMIPDLVPATEEINRLAFKVCESLSDVLEYIK